MAAFHFILRGAADPGCAYGSDNRRNDNGCGSRRSRAHRPVLAETARSQVSLSTPTNKIFIAETAASCARVSEALMRGLELV